MTQNADFVRRYDGESFVGWEPRKCGEHRTVGPHRAWCYDCGEWCYPDDPCARCKLPQLPEWAPPNDRLETP